MNNREYFKKIINEGLFNEDEEAPQDEKKKKPLCYPKIFASVFTDERNPERCSVMITFGWMDKTDAEKIATETGGKVVEKEEGRKKNKAGFYVTQGRGKRDVIKGFSNYYVAFKAFTCNKDLLGGKIKEWVIRTLPLVINVLAVSEQKSYAFDVNDKTIVLQDDKAIKGAVMQELFTRILVDVNDKARAPKSDINVDTNNDGSDDDMRSLNEKLEGLKNEIYQAFVSGEFDKLSKLTATFIANIDRKWGFKLGKRNAKQIIATAEKAGLTPQSPNWPTFVRSRLAWSRLGFYVCDDPRLPNPTEPKMVYPYDAAVNSKVSKSSIRVGTKLIGHQGTDSDIWHNNGGLKQVGDAGRIEGGTVIGGQHGAAYDKTDVLPIPGMMTWQLFESTPGLKNNILGLLNDAALALETKLSTEEEEKKKEAEEKAKNDPEYKAQMERAASEDEVAKIYNAAIALMLNSESGVKFKLANTGNNTEDFVRNIYNWAKSKVEKSSFTKSANAIAAAITICVVWRTVGKAYLNKIIPNSRDVQSMFSGDDMKKAFTDAVLSMQLEICEDLQDYGRIASSMMPDESGDNQSTDSDVAQPATVGAVNESANGNLFEMKDFTENDFNDAMNEFFSNADSEQENILKESYDRMLSRIENLRKND